jgi:hypothetical protein
MDTVVFEGIGFNKELAAAKSLKDFIEHERHHGLSDDQLKEVHKLCGGKSKGKKEEKTDEDQSTDKEG